MMEKKFRSFLIILAIALAGGLFLASSRLSTNIADSYSKLITAVYGDAQITIYPNEDSPTSYISLSQMNKFEDITEAVVPTMGAGFEYKKTGEQESTYISIQGYNMEDYLAINTLEVMEGSIEDFQGAKFILSKKGAEQLGLSIGDELTADLNGKRRLTLAAVVDNKGMFTQEQGYIQALMPFDTLSKYFQTNSRASQIFIKNNKEVPVDEAIASIQEAYPKYTVERVFEPEKLEESLSQITTPFLLMTFIVMFMSAFIIYSSFKVIMLEKLPVVGTFRSVGATKQHMNAVLLMESIFYGIIGGIGACFLGKGGLYLLSNLMVSLMGDGVEISAKIPIDVYITTFMIGLIMAVVSTILPIMSVSKISLKDIILNNRPHKSRKYLRGTIIGVGLIILGFVVCRSFKGNIAMLTTTLGMFVVIFGIIKVLPMFVLYMAQIIGIIFRCIFGNIGELASKNIKKNSSVLNSITLITIGISILFAISTMSQNMTDQVLDFYKSTFKCDILATVWECDDQILRIMKRNENITNTIEVMDLYLEVEEFNNTSISIEGIQTTQMSPYIVYNIEGDEHELLQELQEGRNIILGDVLKNKYNLQVGDMITIKFDRVDKQYKIIGFMDTLWNNGFMSLVPMKYIKHDTGKKTYDTIFFSTKEGVDAEEVCAQLTDSLAGITSSRIMTVDQQAQNNKEENASIMSMISVFAILAMVIGVVGVINNLMISFIERRQNIAMLRSVGMSKWQVLKMIFIEGLGSGVIGAVGGLIGGVLTCKTMDYILKAMDMPIDIEIVPALFITYFLGGMMITVVGSIIPARGSSKLNIIEAIKYE